jgi:hypothetical protein
MGGCTGKNKSDSNESKSNSTKKPKSNSSSSLPKVFNLEIKSRFCFETHFS